MPAVDFDYYAPATLPEALTLLADLGEDVKVLAGGQSLVPMLTMRLARPRAVVDIHGLDELRGVHRRDGGLEIGALVRHRSIERGDGPLAACPLLPEAASLIGNVRVRAMGTIGGSLAHADPAAEWPAVVRALDGVLVVRGRDGERTIPAADFFTGILSTALRPEELLVAVRLSLPAGRAGYAIEEFSRRAGDFAIIAAVAAVELDAAGRVARARVAIAGGGPGPVRLAAAEQALAGAPPSEETFREALARAPLEIEPDGDVHASAEYRRHLTRVLARRALVRAASRAGGAAGTPR
ncbi:MAG TPA: xanthine dehydrogenase family protein subunit M [bacterium]|nr:xanthine dehydrogenase family protein subunit M [bacterium]